VSDVTHILSAIEQGDPHAAEQLLPLVYEELRRLAAAQVRAQVPDASAHRRIVRRVSGAGHGREPVAGNPCHPC
jgi:ECF sigma factor